MRISDHVTSSFFMLIIISYHHLNYYANLTMFIITFRKLKKANYAPNKFKNGRILFRRLFVRSSALYFDFFYPARHGGYKWLLSTFTLKQCLSRKINKIMSINNTAHKKRISRYTHIANLFFLYIATTWFVQHALQ